ncbi:hypothetical protein PR048_004825 [Dryococelus australis]|uniref:Uncharacterized protein n=1 Tax=Dryococelus australis TaxID=614101 RepID=A0ABQ9I6I8_9NEOP|nr:hypothetical protein PR048_004825 [Dryococelus australis]
MKRPWELSSEDKVVSGLQRPLSRNDTKHQVRASLWFERNHNYAPVGLHISCDPFSPCPDPPLPVRYTHNCVRWVWMIECLPPFSQFVMSGSSSELPTQCRQTTAGSVQISTGTNALPVGRRAQRQSGWQSTTVRGQVEETPPFLCHDVIEIRPHCNQQDSGWHPSAHSLRLVMNSARLNFLTSLKCLTSWSNFNRKAKDWERKENEGRKIRLTVDFKSAHFIVNSLYTQYYENTARQFRALCVAVMALLSKYREDYASPMPCAYSCTANVVHAHGSCALACLRIPALDCFSTTSVIENNDSSISDMSITVGRVTLAARAVLGVGESMFSTYMRRRQKSGYLVISSSVSASSLVALLCRNMLSHYIASLSERDYHASSVAAGRPLRASPLRLLGRKIMQGDMHRGKEGLGSHGLHFGAITTSLSVLRASLKYESKVKTVKRDRMRFNENRRLAPPEGNELCSPRGVKTRAAQPEHGGEKDRIAHDPHTNCPRRGLSRTDSQAMRMCRSEGRIQVWMRLLGFGDYELLSGIWWFVVGWSGVAPETSPIS